MNRGDAGVCAVRALVVFSSLASTALAQQAAIPDAPRWRLDATTEAWMTQTVAIGGAAGNEVLVSLNGGADSSRVYAADSGASPLLLKEVMAGADTFDHRVDSAEAADVHAALYWTGTFSGARTPRVVKMSLGGGDWTYAFPFPTAGGRGDVHVSPSGQRIAAWVYGSSQTHVRVFTETGALLVSQVVGTTGMPLASALSHDGRRLCLMADLYTTIVDTDTGAVLYHGGNVGGGSSVLAVGATGEIFARAMTTTSAYVLRPGQTPSPLVLRSDAPAGWSARCGGVALTADDSHVAFVFHGLANRYDVLVRIYDLTVSEPALVYEDRFSGAASTWSNDVTAVDFSADGRTLAVGLWGDETGPCPEALVYRRDEAGSWGKIASYELGGSAFDLELSPDGSFLAVAARMRHATSSGGGMVLCYDVEPEELTVEGSALPGGTLRMTFRGEPGRQAFLLDHEHLADDAVPLGRAGSLFLRRDAELGVTPILPAIGVSGLVVHEHTLPSDAQVGHTIYFQGATAAPRQLGREFVAVTVAQP